MTPERWSDIDLVELSDVAWQVLDPDGDHEAVEQTWTAHVCAGRPPLPSDADLRTRVEQIATAVSPPAPAVRLRAVAAVMAFLAAHPERRDRGDALHAPHAIAVSEAPG
jgi:hypothetical protein